MNSTARRVFTCFLVPALLSLIYPGLSTPGAILRTVFGFGLMLSVLYIFLRPLVQTLILPLNLLLLGLLTPLTDALLVRWTSAWVGGFSLNYPQSILFALALSAACLPYSTMAFTRSRR